MNTVVNSVLGVFFLALGICGTFLMFKLWGYRFDHEKMVSAAPKPLMRLHRAIGWAYLTIYVVLMFQMVPRLWSYQVEFPPRTVAHFLLGMAIGVILLVKISIVRWFKHLESTMVPFLGTALLLCTFLLVGLSLPFAFRERALRARAAGGDAFSAESLARVKSVLPEAGLPKSLLADKFASKAGLKRGRDVLLDICVTCHDLRTVLVRPKTPDAWVQTVQRMAERSAFLPITQDEQWAVSAYLIAISPELQGAAKLKRTEQITREEAKAAVEMAVKKTAERAGPYDAAKAKALFLKTCSGCHAIKNVDRAPPRDVAAARSLVARMVDNGLVAREADLAQIIAYLERSYVPSS